MQRLAKRRGLIRDINNCGLCTHENYSLYLSSLCLLRHLAHLRHSSFPPTTPSSFSSSSYFFLPSNLPPPLLLSKTATFLFSSSPFSPRWLYLRSFNPRPVVKKPNFGRPRQKCDSLEISCSSSSFSLFFIGFQCRSQCSIL